MIIQFDHQIFCEQRFGGISRYFYELIKGLKKKEDVSIANVNLFLSENVYADELFPNKTFGIKNNFKGKKDLARIISKISLSNTLRKQNFDIYHPTYYDSYYLKFAAKKPIVITIYDLIDEKYNNHLAKYKRLLQNKKRLIEQADLIIAISENTKKDILEFYQVPSDKISVIHLGNSIHNSQKNHTLNNSSSLLYVGSRKGLHKNFLRFIAATAKLLHTNKELILTCAGGGEFTNEENNLLKKLNITEKIKYAPITGDKELVNLYQSAIALIYPSTYEGFGFPLIEAFECGCPVICASGSSLSEVAGDAAYYFNATDEVSIFAAIENVVNNNSIQLELQKAGFERAKHFTWEKTINATYLTYKSIIN